jgi:hypothetical protein
MRIIPLTQNKVALINDDDFDSIAKFKWQALLINGTWYAVMRLKILGKKKAVYMHRFLMNGIDASIFVDHLDGDGLNNQRSNLRRSNRSQNGVNRKKRSGCSSKFLGVYFQKRKNRWIAFTRKDGVKHYLGCFEHEADAALAYNNGAIKHHGNFARLNKVQ